MMQEFYKSEQLSVNRLNLDNDSDLIKHIIKTKNDLNFANINFEFAENDLVDYYIYEIKANQAKLDYLIKMAKIKGLNVNFIKELGYRLSSFNEDVV